MSKTNHFYGYHSKNKYGIRYIDILISSGNLKDEFLKRCSDLDVEPERVAIEAGITAHAFNKEWLKSTAPKCSQVFDQERFIKMFQLVGINLRVTMYKTEVREEDLEWIKYKPKDEQKIRIRQIKEYSKRQ